MERPSVIMEKLYWKSNPEWYTYDKAKGFDGYKMNPDAPEQAKKSFEEWYKQKDN